MRITYTGTSLHITSCELCDWVSGETAMNHREVMGKKARHMRLCHPGCNIKISENDNPKTKNLKKLGNKPKSFSELYLNNGKQKNYGINEAIENNTIDYEIKLRKKSEEFEMKIKTLEPEQIYLEWRKLHNEHLEELEKMDKKNKQKKIK